MYSNPEWFFSDPDPTFQLVLDPSFLYFSLCGGQCCESGMISSGYGSYFSARFVSYFFALCGGQCFGSGKIFIGSGSYFSVGFASYFLFNLIVWETMLWIRNDFFPDPDPTFQLISDPTFLSLWFVWGAQIFRDYPRPPFLQYCARNILPVLRDSHAVHSVLRETLTQYITFKTKRGGRGESVLLYSATMLSCIDPSVRIVAKFFLIF
jgi:hypothetical protein